MKIDANNWTLSNAYHDENKFFMTSKKLLLSLLEYKKCFFKIPEKDMEWEEKKDIKF